LSGGTVVPRFSLQELADSGLASYGYQPRNRQLTFQTNLTLPDATWIEVVLEAGQLVNLTGQALTPATSTFQFKTKSVSTANSYWVSPAGDNTSGDGSQANPWKTVTHALSQSQMDSASKDAPITLQLTVGTYSAVNGETFPLALKDYVNLQGAGIDLTLIDGTISASSKSPQLLVADGTVGITLSDLSLQKTQGSAGTSGGGLSVTNQSSLTLQGVRIWQHTGQGEGAGIYLANSSLTLIDVKLIDNQATYGGGIYSDDADLLITESLISRNWADKGGGIYALTQPPVLDQNDIYSNIAAVPITSSGQTFESHAIYYDGSSNLSARNNFWNTNQANQVSKRAFSVNNAANVEILPILQASPGIMPPVLTAQLEAGGERTEDIKP
ncbi:MAG: DUF1565 domain-containing protein, partial [Gammaproteobacteria bacterium]|nr:DUF1565 domain-containing protein [Gammaproteobacteria bacterium]